MILFPLSDNIIQINTNTNTAKWSSTTNKNRFFTKISRTNPPTNKFREAPSANGAWNAKAQILFETEVEKETNLLKWENSKGCRSVWICLSKISWLVSQTPRAINRKPELSAADFYFLVSFSKRNRTLIIASLF